MSENISANQKSTKTDQKKTVTGGERDNSIGTIVSDRCEYEILGEIGTGSYGEVFRAKCIFKTSDDQEPQTDLCAIKRFKSCAQPESYGVAATTLRELQVLQSLSHTNIIKIRDIVLHRSNDKLNTKTKDIYAVFNLCDTDLRKHVSKLEGTRKRHQVKNKLSPQDKSFQPFEMAKYLDHVKRIMFQTLMGLAHSHSRRVIHRDLKPANIFLLFPGNNDRLLATCVVKIGDFGLARAARIPIPPLTRDIATLWYRAPEILLGSNKYSSSVDIWSLGCIMAEIVRVSPLFFGECELETLLQIFKVLGTPTPDRLKSLTDLEYFVAKLPKWTVDVIDSLANCCKGLDSEGVDLLSKMLELNPETRITARDALVHPWFDSIDKSEYTYWNDGVPDWVTSKTVKRQRTQKSMSSTRKSIKIIETLASDPDLERKPLNRRKKSSASRP